jgi:hypothetical protein
MFGQKSREGLLNRSAPDSIGLAQRTIEINEDSEAHGQLLSFLLA